MPHPNKSALPTLSVAIPAFNEEVNIGHLIDTLMTQNRDNFKLGKITVYSDGGTDGTDRIVTSLGKKYRQLELLDFPNRRGKIFRLNQIFHDNTSDILVVLDADIDLRDKHFLSDLAAVLIHDPRANLVAADPVPVKADGLVPGLLYWTFLMWDYIRLSVPNQDHVQNLWGSAIAYRKSFAHTLEINDGSGEERIYLYLMAKKTDSFRYCRQARAYYWPVTTISDFIKLANRAFSKQNRKLDELFGFKTERITFVSRNYKIAGLARFIYEHPLQTLPAILANAGLRILTYLVPLKQREFWETALSTKKPFTYVK
jgi:glycosyltransferase involved in cell wall biosynthesis